MVIYLFQFLTSLDALCFDLFLLLLGGSRSREKPPAPQELLQGPGLIPGVLYVFPPSLCPLWQAAPSHSLSPLPVIFRALGPPAVQGEGARQPFCGSPAGVHSGPVAVGRPSAGERESQGEGS